MEQSKGHKCFLGPFEYFVGVDGTLYRAPKDCPLDVWGYRMGARFEATPIMAERMVAMAREVFN